MKGATEQTRWPLAKVVSADLTAPEVAVLAFMARRYDEGKRRLTLRSIAEATGLALEVVRDAINSLAGRGLAIWNSGPAKGGEAAGAGEQPGCRRFRRCVAGRAPRRRRP